MHLSLNWLSDHVDLGGLEPAAIADALTLKTALIEGFVDQRAALAGVVVGEVLACRPHPRADRLSLCRVDAGTGTDAAVVCGAPNVATGQKIIYAPVGTRLPNGLKLKAAKIRGELSEGMICAEDEIGLGPEHDGILVLDAGLEAGRPIAEVGKLADVVFEIDNKSVTHRPDLWGHRGFARELAAIFGRDLKPLAIDATLVAGDEGPSIELEAGEGCPYYAGLCIEDAPSRAPDWMRFRLIACGMRPIGLLVDLSNYVMLELGQPTHPFDRDHLAGDRIVVRRASEAETMTTLDGEERLLLATDTVIADGERPVALAGIMGGQSSEVGDSTRRVFLESASFDPIGVRRTSSRLGLRSDALARFEKGLDPALVEQALRRYGALLAEVRPGATIGSTFRVAGAAQAPERRIALSGDHVRGLLGLEIADDEIAATLASIGFGVSPGAAAAFEVDVPSWRSTRDVTIPEDLIEEVGRLAGYDRLDATVPSGRLRLGQRDALLALEDRLRDLLMREGCTESISYSMAADLTLQHAGWPADAALPRLANPLQQDAARLRPDTAPGLLARLEDWLRADERVLAFEVGRGYASSPDGPVRESREISTLLAWRGPRDGRDVVRDLRGVAERVLSALGHEAVRIQPWEPDERAPWLHPRRSARLSVAGREAEREVGRLGAVAPGVLEAFDVDGSAGVLRLDVAALSELADQGRRFQMIPRFPPVRIDLAFVSGYDVGVDTLRDTIRTAGPKTLRQVEAFDVYRGAPLDENERSVAFHLVFQAKDRTLTDADVERARTRIVTAVEKTGARLRGSGWPSPEAGVRGFLPRRSPGSTSVFVPVFP